MLTFCCIFIYIHQLHVQLDGTRGGAVDVMPLPAVTLTFDLLAQKPNQYVS